MAIESEPSHNLDESPSDEARLEKSAQLLLSSSPDELIDYSQRHFGQFQRHVAIRACEKQLRLFEVTGNIEKFDSYLAVLPTLWGLYDESRAQ